MPDLHLQFMDLGRLDYAAALARQRALHDRVLAGEALPTVLFVEHPPVITISQRRGAAQNILADRRRLAMLGIDVQATARGGDVTYHGPGQVVVYPIVRLAELHFNVGRYIRFLEQVMIDTLAMFDVTALRVEKCTGVWVEAGDIAKPQAAGGGSAKARAVVEGIAKARAVGGVCATNAGLAKIGAIGVRVKRNVTLHGLALNVATNLAHFDTILPCGLANRSVTSLKSLRGAACPTMEAVKSAMRRQFGKHYGAALATASSANADDA